MKYNIPVWEKILLTVDEAAALFNINKNKIRKISNDDNCSYVLWNGNKKLIKRKQFEKYLFDTYSI